MPAVDSVLLLCIGLTLLGLIATAVSWRRGSKGRVLQAVGATLAPVALYVSGLLQLIWDGVLAVGDWVSRLIFSPTVWLGLSLLALCLVLWVVGGLVARRYPAKPRPKAVSRPEERQAVAPAQRSGTSRKPADTAEDDDLAEIEALLKSRGIE